MAKARNSPKTMRVERVLPAKTETDAIERALDSAIAEHERNRVSLKASERFIKSGIPIEDVFGKLRD